MILYGSRNLGLRTDASHSSVALVWQSNFCSLMRALWTLPTT
jgi:hypothetical protein